MNLGASTIQRKILKPAAMVWLGAAVLMMAAVTLDMYHAPGGTAVARIFKHADNLTTPAWIACSEAVSRVPADATVLVETDSRYFFYLLRYRLYPTIVISEREIPSSQGFSADSIDCIVSYRDGRLGVTEGQPK